MVLVRVRMVPLIAVVTLLALLLSPAAAAGPPGVEELFGDVKEAMGFVEADFPVQSRLDALQEGDVLAAGTGIQIFFPSPDALLAAPQGEAFEAEDLHSDATLRGRVTAAKTFWRGPKIQVTAVELLGRRHRLATKAVVFQGKSTQAVKLLKDVEVSRGWPLVEPLRAVVALPLDRPFGCALALHGIAALLGTAYVWRISTRKAWGTTTTRLQFVKSFWACFYSASLPVIVLGAWLVGRQLGVAEPPLSWDWFAGSGLGLGAAFCGSFLSGLFGTVLKPLRPPVQELARVGLVKDDPPSGAGHPGRAPAAVAADPGLSNDW